MISAIFTVIIRIIFFIISHLFSLILSFFPSLTNISAITNGFALFFGFCEQGLNLLYFLSGDLIFIFIDIWFVLWTFKHIVLPIINFTRKSIMDLF